MLRALKDSASAAPPSSTIVFLGDNVYERGIPPAGAPEFPEAIRRLDDQIAVARTSDRRAVFVPGNHDWARHGDDGWASMQRADSAVAARGKNRDGTSLAVLLPHNGCPGPETVDVGRRIRLIALDTNWWLHGGPKPGRATAVERALLPRPATACPAESEAQVSQALRAALDSVGDRMAIVVAHHPLVTGSEHGGHYHPLFYTIAGLPLPVPPYWFPVGALYVLLRRARAHPQDWHSPTNRKMRQGIQGTFSPDRPLIYASGHDHTLQVIERAGRFLLVSGAGNLEHESYVAGIEGTRFKASRPGFMRVDVTRSGAVYLRVLAFDGHARPFQAYALWLKSP